MNHKAPSAAAAIADGTDIAESVNVEMVPAGVPAAVADVMDTLR